MIVLLCWAIREVKRKYEYQNTWFRKSNIHFVPPRRSESVRLFASRTASRSGPGRNWARNIFITDCFLIALIIFVFDSRHFEQRARNEEIDEVDLHLQSVCILSSAYALERSLLTEKFSEHWYIIDNVWRQKLWTRSPSYLLFIWI